MKKIIDSKDFFDDCPICQLLKAAEEQQREPTLEEFKEAFQKAKEKGAVVGGKWFEDDN
jgi:hypothetical protein